MALLLPTIQWLRQSSKKVGDLRNIREVGQGLLAWIQEANQGKFPYAYVNRTASSYPAGFDVGTLPQNYTYWAGAVYHGGYVSDVERFFSPLQKEPYWRDPAFSKALKTNASAWQWAMVGYGASGILMPYSSDVRGVPTRSLRSLEGGAEIILLADGAPPAAQSSNGKYDGFHAVRPRRNTYPLAVRLKGKVTALFVDGHAQVLSPQELGWDEEQNQWSSTVDDTRPPWNKM